MLLAPSPVSYRHFQRIGVSQFFRIAPTLDDAIALLRPPSPVLAFPASFSCPICGNPLLARRTGAIRCRHCKSELEIASSEELIVH